MCCVCVCAAEMFVILLFFFVTAPVNRSPAPCQASKVGYVIKDFRALYQVLVCVRVASCVGGWICCSPSYVERPILTGYGS